MRRPSVYLLALLGLLLILPGAAPPLQRVMIVDSYHEGYAWSDGIVSGAKSILGDRIDVEVVRMDTKRNTSDEFKTEAGRKAKEQIDAWQPDVVISCDDNASKYLVVPFLKDTELPVVFCGLNWDETVYGFPCDNVTGMIEVSVVPEVMAMMRKHAGGDRMGFLGADNTTDHKEADHITKRYGLEMTTRFVSTFEDWKKAYLELQDQVDMFFVVNNAGIEGWEDEAATEFVLASARVPTGTCHDHIAPFVLVTFGKMAEEQGEWAAATALRILEGTPPRDIPVTSNKKGRLILNMKLARALDITFPLELLKGAEFIK
jgi:ABC-type uncharacterized transport system substrate-binding protein